MVIHLEVSALTHLCIRTSFAKTFLILEQQCICDTIVSREAGLRGI